MAKSTLEVSLLNRNVVLKAETKTAVRQIARLILDLKSERLIKELESGIIAGDKLIVIKITNAENSNSGVEVI